MKIELLRKLAGNEVVDYVFLMSALKGYAYPRDKISSWLASGELIRIKKGLYVFGSDVAQTPYSLEVIANLIYGPSALSLGYALSYYGFIPERVHTITSITNKRNKSFTTPVGEFTYKYLCSHKYSVGIELVKLSNNQTFLMASPEKAICDYIHLIDKKMNLTNFNEIEGYLLHDLRIDEAALRSMRTKNLTEVSLVYNDARLILLTQFIKKWKSA